MSRIPAHDHREQGLGAVSPHTYGANAASPTTRAARADGLRYAPDLRR